MPKTTRKGQAKKEELPDTIKRSDVKAQRTYAKAHDSAVEEYGSGRRAHQVAYAALKHTHEKVGDHWESKEEKGPSDKQAKNPRSGSRPGPDKPTAGGVGVKATKEHLYKRARQLDIPGRSQMNKGDLARALEKEGNTRTSGSGKSS